MSSTTKLDNMHAEKIFQGNEKYFHAEKIFQGNEKYFRVEKNISHH